MCSLRGQRQMNYPAGGVVVFCRHQGERVDGVVNRTTERANPSTNGPACPGGRKYVPTRCSIVSTVKRTPRVKCRSGLLHCSARVGPSPRLIPAIDRTEMKQENAVAMSGNDMADMLATKVRDKWFDDSLAGSSHNVPGKTCFEPPFPRNSRLQGWFSERVGQLLSGPILASKRQVSRACLSKQVPFCVFTSAVLSKLLTSSPPLFTLGGTPKANCYPRFFSPLLDG